MTLQQWQKCPAAGQDKSRDLNRGCSCLQDVYEEVMLHRTAGDASALALESFEAEFAVAREWVTAEPRTDDSFTRHGRTLCLDMLVP